jgi:type II secretory pathway component PulF
MSDEGQEKLSEETPQREPDAAQAGAQHVTATLLSAKSRAAGLSADDLITLNEEIAGMARAGLPLDQGLAALAREMGHGRLRRVTIQLTEDLQAGYPLPEALRRQGKRVPPFYAAVVAAGIRTGRVSEVLGTLTIYTRALADLRATVLGALYYPAVVVLVGMLLFGFVAFFLLPPYEALFQSFRLQVPLLTRVVFEIGKHPLVFVVLPLVFILGCLLSLRFVLRSTERGRHTWVRFLHAIPIAGTLVRAARLSAFTELLAILVDHAVPLPEAFRLAGAASSDPFIVEGAARVEDDLAKGQTLGEVLHRQGLVPELVAWMTAVGELRGGLGSNLHQVSLLYRRQAELRASILKSVLPPIFVLGTAGIMVVMFVFAVMIPLLQLLRGLSGN